MGPPLETLPWKGGEQTSRSKARACPINCCKEINIASAQIYSSNRGGRGQMRVAVMRQPAPPGHTANRNYEKLARKTREKNGSTNGQRCMTPTASRRPRGEVPLLRAAALRCEALKTASSKLRTPCVVGRCRAAPTLRTPRRSGSSCTLEAPSSLHHRSTLPPLPPSGDPTSACRSSQSSGWVQARRRLGYYVGYIRE